MIGQEETFMSRISNIDAGSDGCGNCWLVDVANQILIFINSDCAPGKYQSRGYNIIILYIWQEQSKPQGSQLPRRSPGSSSSLRK